MKKMTIILILIISLLSGCYNYKDVDNIVFVTDILIDVDNNNDIILYVNAYKGIRSADVTEESGEILHYVEKGKTTFEAFRNISLYSNSKINGSQNKAIIFTEKAARNGIDKFINFLERDQEFNLRTRIYIYSGEPRSLMELHMKEEQYVGIYLQDVMNNSMKASSKTLVLNLNDLLNKSYSKSETYTIPMIKIIGEGEFEKLVLYNSAIMKKWYMVGQIPKEEMLYYNFLNNNIKSGILVIPNPDDYDYYVDFEILKSKTKTESELIKDAFLIKKKIKINVSFGEAQKSIRLNEENLEWMKNQLGEKIKKETESFFINYKKKGYDLIGAQNLFARKYPNMSIPNILPQTQLAVEVNVTIEGSSDMLDFPE